MTLEDAVTRIWEDESWQSNIPDAPRSNYGNAACACLVLASQRGEDLAAELARQLRILRAVNHEFEA